MRHLLRPLICLLLLAPFANAQLELPAIFGDHMVLQAQSQVPVWGVAGPNAAVQISGGWWPGDITTQADADGKWQLELRTPQTGGPYSLSVSSGGQKVQYSDVVLGEVWLCGGQSNMEWTLGPGVGPGIQNWKEEVATANFPQIRLYDVPHKITLQPQWKGAGAWKRCSPESVSKFSAIGYLFGRELHQELQVPIGLISCNWGGTVAEAWTSEETLAKMKDFASPLQGLADLAVNGGGDQAEMLTNKQKQWWKKVNRLEALPAFAVSGKDESAAGWATTALPASWSGDLQNFDGVAWYRREVEVPANWSGKNWVLELGPIDDFDTVWLNRTAVASTHESGHWNQARKYSISAEHTIVGKCVISVRVVDSGGGGGFIGKAGDMRLYVKGKPENAISLAGDWQWRQGSAMSKLGAYPLQTQLHPNLPTVLHNGMLRPVIPFAIKGAIWYQGESNRTRAAQYQRLFPNMIKDWRRLWKRGNFPFYFVQIAPFNYGGDQGQAAALREAQTMAMSVPNTGMAVTMDVGDPGNIHPVNKQAVGHRLALWAFAKTYRNQLKSMSADELVYSGPLLKDVVARGNILQLSFKHGYGLGTRDGKAPSHFQIAGADRKFHPAKARIVIDGAGKASVWLFADAVPSPVAARYAWGAADEPNLQNGAGLPAPSFRTDDWPAHP
jgi:sialate O-acetylesterase